MSADFERLNEIFDAASELTPAERAAYLAKACAGDDALQKRVEALLRAHDLAAGFLSRGALGQPIGPTGEDLGAMIGRYKLVELIGEGGFGVVYRAEQTVPVRRQAALKIVKLGMDTRQVIARFEAERQALALMDHPNIAKVLDAGTTETGRPYFVMELVQGVPITEYCDQHQYPTAQRLALFVQVCQAVQHAHQKGIIHRDLKPSNILVTELDGKPVPKVIDFGVAKALGRKLTDLTLVTMEHQFLGTPVYCSPEQVDPSAEDVDTRSDIYSLGVLLYELLTGCTPFDPEALRQAGWNEVLRILREKDPPRPSTRLTTMGAKELDTVARLRGAEPARLPSQLRGDLDWIVMKALEKDRNRRYASASTLALDIGRHLRHEPVEAAAPSVAYRTGKFIRRHRLGVAASGAVVTALIAVAVVAVVSNFRIKREAYYSSIALADFHIREGSIHRAKEILFKCPPKFRQWEWGRLMLQCHQDIASIKSHNSLLLGLAFTPDGRRIVSRGTDGTLKMWDWEAQREVAAFGHKTNRITAWSLSADGQRLALANSQGDLRMLETRTWQALWQTNLASTANRPPPITELASSPDGRLLAGTGTNLPVIVWNAASGQVVFPALPHSNLVNKLWFSPEGERLLAQEQRAVYGWDTASGQEVSRFVASGKDCLVFSDPGGQHVVTIDSNDEIKVWSDRTNSAVIGAVRSIMGYRRVFFSPDGRRFCTGGEFGTARAWDEASHAELLAIPMRVYEAAFSPEGERLVTTGYHNLAYVWDVKSRRQLLALKGHSSMIQCVTFSPDGRLVATGDTDGTVKVWSASPGREVFPGDFWGYGIAWHPKGKSLVGAVHHGLLSSWDADTGAYQRSYLMPCEVPVIVNFSPDGRRFAAIGTDRLARIFATATGRHLGAFTNHQRLINMAMAWSRDGRFIGTCDFGGTAHIWDADSWKVLQTLPTGASNTLQSMWWIKVQFSPDSTRLVTGGPEGRVWEVASGRLLFALRGHVIGVNQGLFTPDGRHIVTAGLDSTLRFWDAQSGALLRTLPTRGPVCWMDISPDGSRLALCLYASKNVEHVSAGLDGPLLEIWDVQQGRSILPLAGHTEIVNLARFSPDGRRLLTASMDMTLRQWETFPWQESAYPSAGATNLAQAIRHYADGYWRARLAAEATATAGNAVRPKPSLNELDRSFWPPRPKEAGPNQIDLTPYYNTVFDRPFPCAGDLSYDNDLRNLRPGLVTLGGVAFDVRGVIVLRYDAGSDVLRSFIEAYPTRIEGIKIGRKFKQLQVFHGCPETVIARDTSLAAYVLRYADGTQQEFEVIYGRDLLDFWKENSAPPESADMAVEAWTGRNPSTDLFDTTARLFRRTYANPKPDVEVVSIDFVSKMAACAPFLIAMTVE